MSGSAEVLEEFGQSLGIEGMTLTSPGAIQLQFEERGVLWLELFDEVLMVGLVRELQPGDESAPVFRKALGSCHYRQGLPYVVQPGLRGDASLSFVVRLEGAEVSLPALEQVLGLLTDLHDSVGDG